MNPEINTKLKRARRRALGLSILIGMFGAVTAYLIGPHSKPLWLAVSILVFGLMLFLMVYRGLLGYCKLYEEEKKPSYTEKNRIEQELEDLQFDPLHSHLLTNVHRED